MRQGRFHDSKYVDIDHTHFSPCYNYDTKPVILLEIFLPVTKLEDEKFALVYDAYSLHHEYGPKQETQFLLLRSKHKLAHH